MVITKKPPHRRKGLKDSEATRAALLRAGMQLFSKQGFDGTSLEQIARIARVNKAMVNYHFGSKEGLYEAILIQVLEPVGTQLRDLAAQDRPPQGLLREYVAAFADLALAYPSFPPMVLREVISGGARLEEHVLPHFMAIFGSVRRIIDRGTREGAFREVNPLLAHLTVVAAMMFFFSTHAARQRFASRSAGSEITPPTSEDFVLFLQDLITRGLSRERE